MKARVIVLLAAVSFVAMAEAKVRPYASLSGGLSLINNADVSATLYGDPPMTGTGKLDVNTGGNIEGALGIGLSGGVPIRLEVAAGYQRNSLHALDTPNGSVPVDGSISIGTLMGNIYYDVMDGESASQDDPLVPYVFGGVGVIHANGDLDGEKTNDSLPAANIGVGLGYYLSEHLMADLKYKYLFAKDLKVSDDTGSVDIEMSAHQFQIGLRYFF